MNVLSSLLIRSAQQTEGFVACVTQSVVRQYDSSCKRMINAVSVTKNITKNISQHSLNIHIILHNEIVHTGEYSIMLRVLIVQCIAREYLWRSQKLE